MTDKKIAVVMGGPSSEREVSLRTGGAIADALEKKGYDITRMDLSPETFPQDLIDKKIEIVFNAVHGLYGEDGRMQGMLDMLKIPYTGSGVEANVLAMDKIISKQMFILEDIPTPRSIVLSKTLPIEELKEKTEKFTLPVMLKPPDQGSTIGMSKVSGIDELEGALKTAFEYSDKVLAEEFIEGREFTVAVLKYKGQIEALPVIEIRPHSGAYDYHSKYTAGATTYLVPAPIDEEITAAMQAYSKKMFDLFGCQGVARVDFMMDDKNNLYALELNTVPGMTATSLVPKAAAAVGISFEDLCERILDSAFDKCFD